MTVTRFNMPRALAFSGTGVTIPNATLTFYDDTFSALQDTFQDETLSASSKNTNPVVADNDGRFPNIFLDEVLYGVVFQDANEKFIWDASPVNTEGASTGDVRQAFYFTGDGATTAFDTLTSGLPTDQKNWDIHIQGIAQEKLDTVYSITGSVINFTSAPPNTMSIEAVVTQPLSEVSSFSFVALIDTPDDYTGAAGKIAKVNAAGDGVEYGIVIVSGSGTPEGSVTAVVGSIYTDTAGGASTTLYIKESGSGNTGWSAK